MLPRQRNPLPRYEVCLTLNTDGHADSWRVEADTLADLWDKVAAVRVEVEQAGTLFDGLELTLTKRSA